MLSSRDDQRNLHCTLNSRVRNLHRQRATDFCNERLHWHFISSTTYDEESCHQWYILTASRAKETSRESLYMKENHSERHKIVDELMTYRARVDFTQIKDTHFKSNQARKKRERIKINNVRSLKNNERKRVVNDDIVKKDDIWKKKIVLILNILFTCLNIFCYSSCFKQIYCYQHNLCFINCMCIDKRSSKICLKYNINSRNDCCLECHNSSTASNSSL